MRLGERKRFYSIGFDEREREREREREGEAVLYFSFMHENSVI